MYVYINMIKEVCGALEIVGGETYDLRCVTYPFLNETFQIVIVTHFQSRDRTHLYCLPCAIYHQNINHVHLTAIFQIFCCIIMYVVLVLCRDYEIRNSEIITW